jgi:hypothetical protein
MLTILQIEHPLVFWQGLLLLHTRENMDFEGEHTRDLLALARRALQGDSVSKELLCAAAVGVIDNPPRDGVLRSLVDEVCQAVFDWTCFDGPRTRLEAVIEDYQMAASALEVDERLNKLRH